MAKKKTEEVIEEVVEQEETEEVIEEVVEQEETEEVIETTDITNDNAAEDKKKPITRSTPFGIEVWNPETKTTTMKPNG